MHALCFTQCMDTFIQRPILMLGVFGLLMNLGVSIPGALADEPSSPASPATCPNVSEFPSEHLKYQSSSRCMMSVTTEPVLPPGSNPGTRSYVTSTRGRLVVTSSEEIPGESRLSRTVGSRSFYVFPRVTVPAVALDSATNTVSLTLSNSERLNFDAQTGRVREYTGAEFHEAPEINLRNQGGFSFGTPRSGLILDCGWALGRVAIENPNGSCSFKDRLGQTCSRPNSEIFKYLRSSSGTLLEVELNFETDELLATYLRSACPSLDSRWRPEPAPATSTEACTKKAGAIIEAQAIEQMEQLIPTLNNTP